MGLPCNSYFPHEPRSGTGYKVPVPHLNWMHFYIPASLLCFCCKVGVSQSNASSAASSQGTISSTMKTHWQEFDQKTRSVCRLVIAILDGKVSLWLRSTHISQSLAEFSRHKLGGKKLAPSLSSSWMKNGSCGTIVWPLVFNLLCSGSAVKHLNTWLHHQGYLPCIRLVL